MFRAMVPVALQMLAAVCGLAMGVLMLGGAGEGLTPGEAAAVGSMWTLASGAVLLLSLGSILNNQHLVCAMSGATLWSSIAVALVSWHVGSIDVATSVICGL